MEKIMSDVPKFSAEAPFSSYVRGDKVASRLEASVVGNTEQSKGLVSSFDKANEEFLKAVEGDNAGSQLITSARKSYQEHNSALDAVKSLHDDKGVRLTSTTDEMLAKAKEQVANAEKSLAEAEKKVHSYFSGAAETKPAEAVKTAYNNLTKEVKAMANLPHAWFGAVKTEGVFGAIGRHLGFTQGSREGRLGKIAIRNASVVLGGGMLAHAFMGKQANDNNPSEGRTTLGRFTEGLTGAGLMVLGAAKGGARI